MVAMTTAVFVRRESNVDGNNGSQVVGNPGNLRPDEVNF
jgi:hypothetical protein